MATVQQLLSIQQRTERTIEQIRANYTTQLLNWDTESIVSSAKMLTSAEAACIHWNRDIGEYEVDRWNLSRKLLLTGDFNSMQCIWLASLLWVKRNRCTGVYRNMLGADLEVYRQCMFESIGRRFSAWKKVCALNDPWESLSDVTLQSYFVDGTSEDPHCLPIHRERIRMFNAMYNVALRHMRRTDLPDDHRARLPLSYRRLIVNLGDDTLRGGCTWCGDTCSVVQPCSVQIAGEEWILTSCKQCLERFPPRIPGAPYGSDISVINFLDWIGKGDVPMEYRFMCTKRARAGLEDCHCDNLRNTKYE